MSESYYDSKYRTSEPGEHDKILGLIQSGNWAQAFSFLELGVAQEWSEDAKVDLVWDIYDGLEEFHQKNIRPLERLIYRYDTRNNPFMTKSAKRRRAKIKTTRSRSFRFSGRLVGKPRRIRYGLGK